MKKITYILSFMIFSIFAGSALAAQKTLPSCISNNYGNSSISTERIILKTPQIAEDGSVVGVTVGNVKGLEKGDYVKELSFYNEFRKEPIATFFLSKNMKSNNLKTRIRLREKQ